MKQSFSKVDGVCPCHFISVSEKVPLWSSSALRRWIHHSSFSLLPSLCLQSPTVTQQAWYVQNEWNPESSWMTMHRSAQRPHRPGLLRLQPFDRFFPSCYQPQDGSNLATRGHSAQSPTWPKLATMGHSAGSQPQLHQNWPPGALSLTPAQFDQKRPRGAQLNLGISSVL